jgi:hypothetical protein
VKSLSECVVSGICLRLLVDDNIMRANMDSVLIHLMRTARTLYTIQTAYLILISEIHPSLFLFAPFASVRANRKMIKKKVVPNPNSPTRS